MRTPYSCPIRASDSRALARIRAFERRAHGLQLHDLGVAELARKQRRAILPEEQDRRRQRDDDDGEQQQREPPEQRARQERHGGALSGRRRGSRNRVVGRDEHVAEAPHGLQVARVRRIGLDQLAQPRYLNVDRAIEHVVVASTREQHQLLAGKRLPRMLREHA